MEAFETKAGQLFCGSVAIQDIAREVPPPFYVYSLDALTKRYDALSSAFDPSSTVVCIALKANAQPNLIRPLIARGAGAEVVSGAELALALELSCPASRIVFSGVGKTIPEMKLGLERGIRLFLVESVAEIETLSTLARSLGTVAPIALRLNPDIDPKTHPHIATGVATAKFGFDSGDLERVCQRLRELEGVTLVGVHSHIGSQITELAPLRENAAVLVRTVKRLRQAGFNVSQLDVGGGWGIGYDGGSVPTLHEYAEAIREQTRSLDVTLLLEPGRVLLGPVGAFIMEVLYRKRVHDRDFVIVNAGMNDFVRPALYGAHHRIVPVSTEPGAETSVVDVAGAVCESSDVFGRERLLPRMEPGRVLAILDAGAYGFVMSSNYNLRPRPAELVVEGEAFRLVRPAETIEGLVRRELGS